jgi:hypothetical protein
MLMLVVKDSQTDYSAVCKLAQFNQRFKSFAKKTGRNINPVSACPKLMAFCLYNHLISIL